MEILVQSKVCCGSVKGYPYWHYGIYKIIKKKDNSGFYFLKVGSSRKFRSDTKGKRKINSIIYYGKAAHRVGVCEIDFCKHYFDIEFTNELAAKDYLEEKING